MRINTVLVLSIELLSLKKCVSYAYSVAETDFTTSDTNSTTPGLDDDQALLERLARREERRQKRMKDAMERQKSLDLEQGLSATNGTDSKQEDEQASNTEQRSEEEEADTNSCRREEEKNEEEVD